MWASLLDKHASKLQKFFWLMLWQLCHVQVTGMGEPTGKVLQCSPDAPVLQQNRADFEALTLLMFAAACGNTAETERLLAQGGLPLQLTCLAASMASRLLCSTNDCQAASLAEHVLRRPACSGSILLIQQFWLVALSSAL